VTRVSPTEGTQKWLTRLSGATSEVTAGIAKVTESPGAAAVRSKQKYQNNVVAAFPKWERNTNAVSLQAWQQAATAGASRIAQGAQQKQGKYEAFAQQFYPYLDQQVAKIKSMPNATFEDRVQRAVAMMRGNAAFKRSPGM
jgi:hypothetical protein